MDLPDPVRPTRAQVWPAGEQEVDVAQGERAGAVAELRGAGTPRRAGRRAAGRPPVGSAGEASIARSRSTAPKPSCRSGRWRASMSTPPTNIVVTRNSVTRRAVDRSPDRTSATPTTPTAARAPWSSPPLRRVIRTSTARTASRVWWTTDGEVGVAAQHVGLAQRGADVVAGGDALLGGRGVVGPGRLLDDLALGDLGEQAADESEGDDRGQREQEDRRPPGEGRDHPQRAGGEEGARGLPHAPAHQLADLPRVVVDAVEHLADRLLGELGQRLGHGGVEQVGAQLPLGAVADGGPDRLGDGVDHRPAHDAQRQQGQRACCVGPSARRPATIEPRDAATAPSRDIEKQRLGQRTADPAPVDRHPTRRQSAGRGRGRRCRVGLRLGHRHKHRRYVVAPTSRARFSCDPGAVTPGWCDCRPLSTPVGSGTTGVRAPDPGRSATTPRPPRWTGRRYGRLASDLELARPRGAS